MPSCRCTTRNTFAVQNSNVRSVSRDGHATTPIFPIPLKPHSISTISQGNTHHK